QRPKTIPPKSAIGGDTAPVAATITPIKKMVLASFMGLIIRRIGLQTVVLLSTCQAGDLTRGESHNIGSIISSRIGRLGSDKSNVLRLGQVASSTRSFL